MGQELSYLHQAWALAKNRRGFCSPNPSVGAVIVNDEQQVLSTGYHLGPGFAHAEVDALNKLNGKADGATIYITLEPCCHHGRTPPCTDALIKAKIKRVVYAFQDPNPIVAGKSQKILLEVGISCEQISVPEISDFYKSYEYWHKTKKPFVTAKIALSLDGKITKTLGKPTQLTGLAAQQFTHQQRKQSDAILTTATTIISDDSQLNVREKNEVIAKPIYILDRQLKLPQTAKIFSTAKSITLFHSHSADSKHIKILTAKGVRCVAINEESNKLNLNEVLEKIGSDGIHDLWIEAGGKCFSAFMQQKLLQRAFIYIAPHWLDQGVDAFNSEFYFNKNSKIHWQQLGDDAICEISFNK